MMQVPSNYKVYVHITPVGKLYIGITSQENVKYRWDSGGYGYRHQPLFWKAIQKYGQDNIQHIVLLEELSKEVACECEKYLIAKYNAQNPHFGYNCTAGGEGTSGYVCTEEHRRAISERLKGRQHSEEAKLKMSLAAKSRVMSEEQKKQISDTLKSKHKPAWNKGIKMPEAFGKKVSESLKQNPTPRHTQKHTEATKAKISESCKGRKVSDETREKLRQKALEQWKRQKQTI